MVFPKQTPDTLISRLKYSDDQKQWNDSWKTFLPLYQPAIEASVRAQFCAHGYKQAQDCVINEIVADVVIKFKEEQLIRPFDPKRGHLKSHLKQLCSWRVSDFLRGSYRSQRFLSLSPDESEDDSHGERTNIEQASMDRFKAEEDKAHLQSLLATIITDVSGRVSPGTFNYFDYVVIKGNSPQEAAEEFGVNRGVIDNSIHKVKKKISELLQSPDYYNEIFL